jgi:hypothetical protein
MPVRFFQKNPARAFPDSPFPPDPKLEGGTLPTD